MKKKTRVIVLMGGKSPEHEVSLVGGREVVSHLDSAKYEVLPLVISKDGQRWQLKKKDELLAQRQEVSSAKDLTPTQEVIRPEETPRRADVVFIAMHGPFGEDGTVQGMLEMIGIPYTGAGVLASAIGMDKSMFRKVMAGEKISMAKALMLKKTDNESLVWENFPLPVVVKPSSQGSSVGVSIVHKREELGKALEKAFQYGPRVLVEEYLSGTEVSCGVLGNEDPIALPVVEIVPKNEFFDYEAKYTDGKCDEIVPARIAPKLTKEIQDVAIKVYKAIGCQGFGRVDMIISGGKSYVLEINTIPGLTPASLLPKEAAAVGISYEQLLDRIIELSLEKKS
jgi:D-alanine-D-alanine ligase